MIQHEHLSAMATALRGLSIDCVEHAKSGHPGLPLGMADVVTVLFHEHLRFSPQTPNHPERDRFVLSAGHGSALLYALNYLVGYARPTRNDLMTFRRLHSPCAGHPEYGHLPGIETTTGPLGQGIANAVGMAIAQKKQAEEAGLDYRIYCVVSDGDLMEGISHEACALAGHLNLNNLIILFDDNRITIDGDITLSASDHPSDRFKTYGFDCLSIDGHDMAAIHEALSYARHNSKPTFIACRTIIGKGSPNKQGTHHVHGSPLGAEEYQRTKDNLKITTSPFEVNQDVLSLWRSFKNKLTDVKEIPSSFSKDAFMEAYQALFDEWKTKQDSQATRVLFQEAMNCLGSKIPHLIGGSADLTPSNNTKMTFQRPITRDCFKGQYLHYGIREHAMAAIMNGLSLSGFLPYGGTFLVFSDYLRPALRLSALMNRQVFYIFTHDSIGLGEDGPTHQPIEHLCSLRMIPRVRVFRPCDGLETLESLKMALDYTDGPSVFALSRHVLKNASANRAADFMQKGAYILYHEHDRSQPLDVTLVATGSEIQLALEVAAQLPYSVRVVSLPVYDLFERLSHAEKAEIIGTPRYCAVIEAGQGLSLHYALRSFNPDVFGLHAFGKSAPYQDIYSYFGLDVPSLVEKITNRLKVRLA